MVRTKISSKGQLVIPKAIREERKWVAGAEVDILDTPEGVLVKPVSPRKRYTIDDIIGILAWKGPPKTIEEMNLGIDRALRASWKRKK